MNPREKTEPLDDEPVVEADDAPALEQQDWEGLEGTDLAPESAPENGDLRYEDEPSGELPGEDDDNPFQDSDEALPDDSEEQVLRRDPQKRGTRFDEV